MAEQNKTNTKTQEVEAEQSKVEQTNSTMTDREKELRAKYQNKYIKNTKKDKGMGTLFWVLVGACVACLIFIATIIIVRSV